MTADDTETQRVEHSHTSGIWCDECPDADLKRTERVLEDHEYESDPTVVASCRCVWINPLDGTPHAHRKHVAAALLTAARAESKETTDGKAEAWDEGYVRGKGLSQTDDEMRRNGNPYRAENGAV